jgi:hypothetical protein
VNVGLRSLDHGSNQFIFVRNASDTPVVLNAYEEFPAISIGKRHQRLADVAADCFNVPAFGGLSTPINRALKLAKLTFALFHIGRESLRQSEKFRR